MRYGSTITPCQELENHSKLEEILIITDLENYPLPFEVNINAENDNHFEDELNNFYVEATDIFNDITTVEIEKTPIKEKRKNKEVEPKDNNDKVKKPKTPKKKILMSSENEETKNTNTENKFEVEQKQIDELILTIKKEGKAVKIYGFFI